MSWTDHVIMAYSDSAFLLLFHVHHALLLGALAASHDTPAAPYQSYHATFTTLVAADLYHARAEMSEWSFKDEFWFPVTFVYRSHDAQRVFLCGDFCGWQRDRLAMAACGEGFSVTVPLSEGFYHYKFLVDGRWERDTHNPHTTDGPFCNSIMFVHMDPGVYGVREQHPPHREHRRGDPRFQTLSPKLPADIAACGVLERLVFVYLPPSYLEEPGRRYPVLYVHDGQNVFSTPADRGGPCRGGMYLDAKLDHYWSCNLLPEFIVVAVPNADFVCVGNRSREYCTADMKECGSDPFIRYLVEVVKATVDEQFRTKPAAGHTLTLGCSMGGLLSLVLALMHPHVFSCGLCLSPALWYVDRANQSAYDLVGRVERGTDTRLYLDSGDGLGDNKHETKAMQSVLLKNGWREHQDFEYFFDECKSKVELAMTHCESVWRERILRPLTFAFSERK